MEVLTSDELKYASAITLVPMAAQPADRFSASASPYHGIRGQKSPKGLALCDLHEICMGANQRAYRRLAAPSLINHR